MATVYSGITETRFFSIEARDRWIVCGITLLLSSRAIFSHLRYGQSNIFVLALLVLGMYWLAKRRRFWGGAAIALSAAVKLTTLPIGFWFLARRNIKVLTGILIGTAFAILLPALIIGINKDIELHEYWIEEVGLKHAPGTGNWDGIGNVSLRAQVDRFFLNVAAFEDNGQPVQVTLIELSPRGVGLIGYGVMFCIALVIIGYAIYFRGASELVSNWGGFAFVSSLIPNFTPVSEIPHLVILIPAQIYVVHLLFVDKLPDRTFKVLVVLSFVLTTLSTKIFLGEFISRWLTAYGSISFGMLLLSASILRAGFLLKRGALGQVHAVEI